MARNSNRVSVLARILAAVSVLGKSHKKTAPAVTPEKASPYEAKRGSRLTRHTRQATGSKRSGTKLAKKMLRHKYVTGWKSAPAVRRKMRRYALRGYGYTAPRAKMIAEHATPGAEAVTA